MGRLINSPALLWLIVATAGTVAFFWDGLISLGVAWARPEYSYGPLVPVVTAYLTLREIHHRPLQPDPSSRIPGLAIVVFGLIVGLFGNVAQIPDIITYGFIILIGGMVLVLAGTREGIRFWPGWLHLIFMLPLPQFIYLHISTKLQVISSVIGVYLIEVSGIPVFLDGNVIDLGVYKLQVAEACSGLRYLFPLFSFGWLVCVLYNGPNWHRVFIFFSTIPVTILMNSFRIGVIGILVNEYGVEYAEGFLHYFEGWVIFISCTAILYVEAYILQRYFTKQKFSSVLNLDMEGVLSPLKKAGGLRANRVLLSAAILISVAGLGWQSYPDTEAPQLTRTPLGIFPLQIGEWQGRTALLDSETERVLGADDYLVANYQADGKKVDLLMTFYRSQTDGTGIHSPEICLPGGGWEVSNWSQQMLTVEGQAFWVNRALIRRGLERQLVYYWFEQRGQKITNDFKAKFLSIWDTITNGRSDGGLIRLVTPLAPTESEAAADLRLSSFVDMTLPMLPSYFPGLKRVSASSPVQHGFVDVAIAIEKRVQLQAHGFHSAAN